MKGSKETILAKEMPHVKTADQRNRQYENNDAPYLYTKAKSAKSRLAHDALHVADGPMVQRKPTMSE